MFINCLCIRFERTDLYRAYVHLRILLPLDVMNDDDNLTYLHAHHSHIYAQWTRGGSDIRQRTSVRRIAMSSVLFVSVPGKRLITVFFSRKSPMWRERWEGTGECDTYDVFFQ